MRKKEEKKTEVTECLPSTYQGREIFHQMGECLNPYYTGIHLHRNLQLGLVNFENVLILIILEYIYMQQC